MSPGRFPRIALAQAFTAVALGMTLVAPRAAQAAHGDGAAVQPTRQMQGQAQQGITTGQPPTPVREVAAQGPLAHADEAAVRVPVEAYLRGHETGEASHFRRAFAKAARLWWVREGQVATRTTEEYITAMTGRGSTDHDHQRRLVNLEVAGDVAVATIEIEYPGVRLTDQLTLQKLGDEWRIVSKAFYSEPRPTVS